MPPRQPEGLGRRTDEEETGGTARWLLPLVLSVVAVVLVYAWTATDGRFRFGSRPDALSLYRHQVEAFHHGQLELLVTPKAELLALPNPYDPNANQGVRLLDASLYQGKYYTYFGVVPIVVWLWPYFELTGRHAPEDLTLLVFCGLGFLFQGAALVLAWRRWFSSLHWVWLSVAVMALGLCNLYQPLLRRHQFYEVAIGAGLCFLGLYLLGLMRVWVTQGRSWWGWITASLAGGLMIGCRPTLGLAGLLLPLSLILLRGEDSAADKGGRKRVALQWCAAGLPAGPCLAGLFAYNLARFDHPLEFGFTYQLATADWRAHPVFSAGNFVFNSYYYLLSIPRLSWIFPFFLEPALHPFPPPGSIDFGLDQVAGVLPCFPFVACALAWITIPPERRELRWLLVLLSLGAAAVGLPLLFFTAVAVRYQSELISLPLFVAVLALWLAAGRGGRGSALLRTGMVALGVYSAVFQFFMTCEYFGYMRSQDPAGWARVGAVADRVVYPVARAFGASFRSPELRLRFPVEKVGTLEPLWVHGDVPAADFLYVYYVTPTQVQLGFESMGRGGPVSDLIDVDYAAEHRITLLAGPFFPPAGHPAYSASDAPRAAQLKRTLRVLLDDDVVLDAVVDFHDGRERHVFGRSDRERAFGHHFTGPLHVTWRPVEVMLPALEDLFLPASYGPLQLDVTWPMDVSPRTEPLASIGHKNRGQLLVVEYLGDGAARLQIRSEAGDTEWSAPLTTLPGETVQLDWDAPAFFPARQSPLAPAMAAGANAQVRVNGRIVLDAQLPPSEAAPGSRAFGRNAVLATGVAPAFSGKVTPR